MKHRIVSCAIGVAAIVFGGILSLMLAMGITGIGICGPEPVSGWSIIVYLFVSATVPAMVSSLLHRFWIMGALSFSWAFLWMACAMIFSVSTNDWSQLALLLACVALSILSSWAGHRLKKSTDSIPTS